MDIIGNKSRSNKITLLLSMIFLLALSARLFHVYQIFHIEPYYKYLMIDSVAYDEWGREIAAGNVLGNAVFFQDPLYPYMLGLIYFIFGHNLTAVVIIQSIFGALSAVLMYLIGMKLFNKAVGIIASLLWGFFPVIIFYEGLIQKEGISVFLTLAFITFILYAIDQDNKIHFLLGGVCAGLSILTRGNIILVVPFILISVVYLKKSIIPAILISLGLLLVLFPISVRNKIVGGEFVITTSQAGANFYVGNNYTSEGSIFPVPYFLRSNPKYERLDFENEARRLSGNPNMTSSETSRFWFNRGLQFITENPVRYLLLEIKKAKLLINNNEINDNYNFHYFKRFSTVLSYSPVLYCLLVSLGLFGMVVYSKYFKSLLIIYIYLLSYASSLLVFYVTGRYRLHFISLLTIFSAAAICWLYKKMVAREYYKIVPSLLAIPILITFSLEDIKWISVSNNTNILLFEAKKFAENGDYNNAIIKYKEADKTHRSQEVVHFNLGEIYYKLNERDLAVVEYRKALSTGKTLNGALIYFKLGISLVDIGKTNEAAEAFRASIAADPEQIGSYFELARLLESMGLISESLKYWNELQIHDRSGTYDRLVKSKIAELTKKSRF